MARSPTADVTGPPAAEPGPAPARAPARFGFSGLAITPGLELVLAAVVAALLLLPGFGHTPWLDEFNHLMGARSLLDRGTLVLVPGGSPYHRGVIFTYLVAGSIWLFGDSFVAARLPAYLAAVGLGVAIFRWARPRTGRLGAWIALLLFLTSPITIFLAQGARFYTLHALAFFASAIFVHRAGDGERRPNERLLWGAAAAVCLLFALSLQPVTVIGAGALGLWLIGRLVLNSPGDARIAAALAAAGLIVALATLVFDPGVLARLWATFEFADDWASGQDNIRYYHWLLINRYPVFWGLFPVSVIYAVRRWPSWGSLLAVGFLAPLAVHSLAAWKTERYVFYALPFFFLLTGGALAALVRWVVAETRRFPGRWGSDGVRRALSAGTAVGAVAAFLLLVDPAFGLAAKMLVVPDAEWSLDNRYRGHPDWASVTPELRRLLEEDGVFLSSGGLKAFFYLGRLDLVLRKSVADQGEFARYPKLGIMAISEPGSVETVVACAPRGLIVVERHHWRNAWAVPSATADAIERLTTPVPLPARSRLLAFRWSRPGGVAPADSCPPLPASRP